MSTGVVAAVVVTFNRKDVLAQCLAAIQAQTRPPDRIVILDNGSTDGSFEAMCQAGLLTRDTDYLRFAVNRGPARAFWQGMSHAYAGGADWLWVMDDDVLPDSTALELLLEAARTQFRSPEEIGFLCSRVRAPDGRPMNTPEIAWRDSDEDYASWAEKMDHGMVKIRRSALISNLFPRSTLRDFPPTPPDYFMWGEDSDFTLRITEQRPAYMLAGSKAVHLRAISRPLHPLTETDPARLRRMRLLFRNTLYLRRRFYPPAEALMTLIDNTRLVFKALVQGKPLAAWTVLSGTVAGLFFRPRIPPTAEPALLAETQHLAGPGLPPVATPANARPRPRPHERPARAAGV
ncbi:glycosyltransferase [Oleisolibacter albus]|uniref:glycosyltransferase n=1 Tax=Oleisolibacter albus TaxID=2171757 RepID=UPI00138FFE26|nr:glycosyltransferase [Oleisolibacter albus]